MKTNRLLPFLLLMAAMIFASCSSNKKELPATITTFTGGSLSKSVELNNVKHQLTVGQSADPSKGAYALTLTAEVKRTAEGDFNSVKASDITFSEENPLTINLLDKNGTVITSLTLAEADRDKLRTLLQQPAGTVEKLTFVSYNPLEDGIKATFKAATMITPAKACQATGNRLLGRHIWKGSIGKYGVVMYLDVTENSVQGKYYYTRYGYGHWLYLSGTNDNGKMEIYENTRNYNSSAYFSVRYNDGRITGEIVNSNINTYHVNVQVTDDEVPDSEFADVKQFFR